MLELRAELDRMRTVIDDLIGPQVERFQQQQRESRPKKTQTKRRYQIESTVRMRTVDSGFGFLLSLVCVCVFVSRFVVLINNVHLVYDAHNILRNFYAKPKHAEYYYYYSV